MNTDDKSTHDSDDDDVMETTSCVTKDAAKKIDDTCGAQWLHRRMLNAQSVEKIEQTLSDVRSKSDEDFVLASVNKSLMDTLAQDNPSMYDKLRKYASKIRAQIIECRDKNMPSTDLSRYNRNWLLVEPLPDAPGARLIDMAYTQLRIDECLKARKLAVPTTHTLLGDYLCNGLASSHAAAEHVLTEEEVELLRKYAPTALHCAVSGDELRVGDRVSCELFTSSFAKSRDNFESFLSVAALHGSLAGQVNDETKRIENFTQCYSAPQTSAGDLCASMLCMVKLDAKHASVDTAAANAGGGELVSSEYDEHAHSSDGDAPEKEVNTDGAHLAVSFTLDSVSTLLAS